MADADPLRLLQLVTRRQLRGAEIFAAQISEGLATRGCEVVLAGLYHPGNPPLTAPGVELVDLAASPRPGVAPGLVIRLRSLIARWRPHLVQANGSDTLKYAVLARALLRRKPPLVYRNISIASRWLRSPAHRAWNRWLFRRVDHVAAVGARSAEDLLATYGVDPGAVSVLPLGTHLRRRLGREEARRSLADLAGVDAHDPLVIHVGSFTEEKDHALLLRAFAETRPRVPDARLVLVGDGPLRSAIEARIEDLGLASSVHLAGTRPEAAELAGGADILVLSSRIEGVPGVVLEAAAREVPTVATDVGGLAEVVHNGATGRLVPPGDPEALAGAMAELLGDPERRRAMGVRARRLVASRHDLESVTDGFLDLYRSLLRDHA